MKLPTRIKTLLAILAGLSLLLSACAQATPQASPGSEIGGYTEFVDALRAAGATVQPGTEIEQPFFPVKGQIIQVNSADVQVFEFADEATRRSVSDTISETGDTIGTSIPSWIDQPNFWAKRRLIVLYVGRDQAIIDLLTGVLGEPITHPSTGSQAQPEAVLAAQKELSAALGIPVEQVQIVSSEQVDWPNGCLGYARADELCTQVITPGWRVILSANGQQYEVRTDKTGDVVRLPPELAATPASATPGPTTTAP